MTSDTEMEALHLRVEKLEERNAFQDQTIEDLNATITDQWKALDRLKRDVERLTSELSDMEQSIGAPAQRDPPPPHY